MNLVILRQSMTWLVDYLIRSYIFNGQGIEVLVYSCKIHYKHSMS